MVLGAVVPPLSGRAGNPQGKQPSFCSPAGGGGGQHSCGFTAPTAQFAPRGGPRMSCLCTAHCAREGPIGWVPAGGGAMLSALTYHSSNWESRPCPAGEPGTRAGRLRVGQRGAGPHSLPGLHPKAALLTCSPGEGQRDRLGPGTRRLDAACARRWWRGCRPTGRR